MVPPEAISYIDKYVSLKINQIENVEKKKEILDLFSSEFLMLPEAWIIRLQLEGYMSYEVTKKLLKRALFDFYSEDILRSIPLNFRRRFEREEKPFDKLMNSRPYKYVLSKCLSLDDDLVTTIIVALSFPHPYLTNIFMLYKEFGGSLPSDEIKQCYIKFNKLYNKIIAADTFHQWFEFVVESSDNRFIIQNVEARIAQDPMNIAFWRIYIEYLKKHDKNMASQVYCRYRRIFLKNYILDLKPVFDFDNSNAYFFIKQQVINCFINEKKVPEFFKTFNYNDTIFRQHLPFRWTLFNYIIKNASENHFKKLNKTCKFIFLQYGSPMCHRLCISNSVKPKYFQESLLLNENFSGLKHLKNLWVQYSLHVQHPSDSDLLSIFLPKIETSTVRFLRISNQSFSTSELEFLTKSKKIRKIILISTIIKDNNGEIVCFEDIFKNLIYAFHIELICKFRITYETFNKLVFFGKNTKTYFVKLLISNYTISFNYMQLVCYLNAISRQDSENWLCCDKELTSENKQYFISSLNNAIQKWIEVHGTMAAVQFE